MPTFREHLNQRSLPFATKKSKPTLHEGMELSPSELLDEMTSPQVLTIIPTVVTDNAEELTILLKVKKWNAATNNAVDSSTYHPDTVQTSALGDR
jgi:hypothetical protein